MGCSYLWRYGWQNIFLVIKLIEKKAFGIWNVGTGKKKLIRLAPNKSTIIKPDHVPYDTSMDLSKLNKFLSDENINIWYWRVVSYTWSWYF